MSERPKRPERGTSAEEEVRPVFRAIEEIAAQERTRRAASDVAERIAERDDAARVVDVKRRLAKTPAALPSPTEIQAKREAYVAEYVPEHLKEARPTVVQRVVNQATSLFMKLRETFGGWHIDGRDQIPEAGAYLAICNHRGGESGVLMGLFAKQQMHLVSGEQIHWERNPLRTWLLKKLGMLPVKESLGYLSPEERHALVARAHPRARAGYAKVVERDEKATAGERAVDLRRSVRSIVACLVRGEPVTVFPEGLFLYDDSVGMRRGYPLADAVALEYEHVTGTPLRMLPIAIDQKHVRVGEVFTTKDLPKVSGVTRTDAVIAQVAQLLPAERQGYYGPVLEKMNRVSDEPED